MKKRVFVSCLFLMIILLPFLSAEFEVGNATHSIQKQYGPGGYIKGWVNISFENEPANSVFSDSLETEIELIKLLKKNENFDYSCYPANCISDYSAENGEETKNINLGNGYSEIIGFKFNEEIDSINSAKFTIQSDATESCYNQIEIDILNDGNIDFINNKSVIDEYCSLLRNYGCFNTSETSSLFSVSNSPNKYCQRIKLPIASGFKIGAYVERNGETGDLIMDLYNSDGEEIDGANCILPSDQTNDDVSCEIDYSVAEPKEHYVCIYADDGEEKAKIKGYAKTNGCGFYGSSMSSIEENAAYKIFIDPKKFDSVGELKITNSLSGGSTLAGKINNYLNEVYGSLDCSSGCVVPVKINSKRSQSITLKDLVINYDTNIGGRTETNFYNLSEEPADITSGFHKLYLDDGNFSVPTDYGEYDFELELDSESVFSDNVSVEKVPVINYVTPTTTAFAVPTKFNVKVDSTYNVSEYVWDFGDNKPKKTGVNKITYTYNSTGTYALKITVKDTKGFSSSKTFSITVGSPEEIIEDKIDKYQKNLENVSSQIKKFPKFYQESIDLILKINESEDKLKEIQQDYAKASTEGDYRKIMGKILDLKIPESIYKSKEADLIPLYPSSDKINLNILQEIGGGYYDPKKEEQYINGISLWNQENIETKFNFDEISVVYEDYEEPLIKVIELKMNKFGNSSAVPYLIIKKLEGLEFDKSYSEKEKSGYVYIDLTGVKDTIVFSTTEDIKFSELPAFISPKIDRLELIEEPDRNEKEKKWLLFAGIMALLIIISSIIYIIIHEWYKKKYEAHLFKNKNNLFNLITYIGNSKKRGVKDKEIVSRLKKTGWNSEQIKYAMKKHTGKKTGMPLESSMNKIVRKTERRNLFRKYR